MNTKSRDNIPALLIGLHAVYTSEATWTGLFGLSDERIRPARGL